MATTNIAPAGNALLETGDSFSCTITAVGATAVTLGVSDGTSNEMIWTLAGGIQAGYTGTATTLTGVTTLTDITRTAAWWNSPLVFTVTETIAGVPTAQVWSYYIKSMTPFAPGTEPYYNTFESGISVTEDDVLVGDDVNQFDFDDATFDVTEPVEGKVRITGLGGGGSAIEAEFPVGVNLTSDLKKLAWQGSAVFVTEPTPDEILVTISGSPATTLADVMMTGTPDNAVLLPAGEPVVFTGTDADVPAMAIYGAAHGVETPTLSLTHESGSTGVEVTGPAGNTVKVSGLGVIAEDSTGTLSTTVAPTGIAFRETGALTIAYTVQPGAKTNAAKADAVTVSGALNNTGEGGDATVIGGSGVGGNGEVHIGTVYTSETTIGGVGGDLVIHDGVDAGAATHVLTSDGTFATWEPATGGGGGGVTNTVAGSLGITNTGNNTDAVLTPTYGTSANTLIHGDDSRLSDTRTPNTHAASHQDGSGDEISVAGLSGLLADPQNSTIQDSTAGQGDAVTLNFGSNLTATVTTGVATINASLSGAAGVNGLGSWNYSTTITAGDPGSGNFRLNNLDPEAATVMYVSNTNGDSQYMGAALVAAYGWRLTFNDSTGAEWFTTECAVPTDGGTYVTIQVSPTGSSSLTNAASFNVSTVPSASFPVKSTNIADTVIVRGDGTEDGIQDSVWDITDGGILRGNGAATGVRMDQRATGPSSENDKGYYWVQDDTATTSPIFTSGDGTEFDLTDAVSRAEIDTTAIHLSTPAGDGEIAAWTEKTNPVGADMLVIEDSAASSAKKMIQISNLPVLVGEAGVLVVDARSSGGTINPGQIVYITGWSIGAGTIEVDLADASSAATMPGYGIAQDTITSAATGQVVVSGEIGSQVTNAAGWAEGDALYVDSTTPGALTKVKPIGTDLIQKLGVINYVHVNAGIIQVVGAGRTNDLPNIAEDFLWLGDSNGVPAATARAGIDTNSATHIASSGVDHSNVVLNDAHRADVTTNPHSTDLGNLASGTLSELNAVVADATLGAVGTGDGQVPVYTSGDLSATTFTGGSGTDFTEYRGYGIAPYPANVTAWNIGGLTDTTGSPIEVSLLGQKSGTTAVAGGVVNVFGGNATVGTADGGDLNLSGGSGFGGGALGKVYVEGSSFELATDLVTSGTIDGVDVAAHAADASIHREIGIGNTAGKTAYETTDYYYHDTEADTYQRYTGAAWEDVGVAVDDVTLEVDATNGLQVKDGGIGNDQLLDQPLATFSANVTDQDFVGTIGLAAAFTSADGLQFLERADHPNTPAATFGQLWVSNDATQKLYFTDDAGTDVDLTAGGGGSGDVTAAATIGNNLLVRGDGAVKGVQNTGITIDDFDNVGEIGRLTPATASAADLGSTPLPFRDIFASSLTAVSKAGGGGTETFTRTSGDGAVSVFIDAVTGGTSTVSTALGGLCAGTADAAVTGCTANIEATALGSIAIGSVFAQSASDGSMEATGDGSVCLGRVAASTTAATMTATGNGSFAGGWASSGIGATAVLSSTGNGSFAFGMANAASITASGAGSLAFGKTLSGPDIVASGANSVQFGPGTNALADSLQVGALTTGIRLCANGDPGASVQNGDIWVASGFVYIRSNGIDRQIT